MIGKPATLAAVLIGLAMVLAAMSYVVNTRLPESALPVGLPSVVGAGDASGLEVYAESMPEFARIAGWINSEPLTAADLVGKVTLIDFWTYSCINCIRTLPYLTAWDEKYREAGLNIVGVHTPEFAFEKDADNVRKATRRHGITYPVALDNDYGTWDEYDNRYWPAKYLFDAQGRLRYYHFGEGDYDVTERNIQELLAEAGMSAAAGVVDVEASSGYRGIGTPETYLGYERADSFSSPESASRDAERTYTAPRAPDLNDFMLAGSWVVEAERVRLTGERGSLVMTYRASEVNLVMGTENGPVETEIRLDGSPVPPAWRGADVVERDGKTWITIDEHRLYSVIDAEGDIDTRMVEFDYMSSGVTAYAFTFG